MRERRERERDKETKKKKFPKIFKKCVTEGNFIYIFYNTNLTYLKSVKRVTVVPNHKSYAFYAFYAFYAEGKVKINTSVIYSLLMHRLLINCF